MAAKQVLKKCSLFASLGDDELSQIAGFTEEKQFDAGATIFQIGDNADELLVIEEGKVALQMTIPQEEGQPPRRITIGVLNAGDMIGWSAIVEPHVYTLTAVCLQKVKVLAINGAKLRRLLKDNPKTGYEVLTGLIDVVASRLDETRRVLVSERLLIPGS